VSKAFVHAHASHCESGVMASLLRHQGQPMSEAMAFGLSSALAFAYLAFLIVRFMVRVFLADPTVTFEFDEAAFPTFGIAGVLAELDRARAVIAAALSH